MNSKHDLDRLITHLDGKRVLLLTTSTRWDGSDDVPKSSQLAQTVASKLGDRYSIIDVSKMHIYQCEGNVSNEKGNSCGVKESQLKDDDKNPSGNHRCWASINHKDDELWKISKELFEVDVVLFFGSVRWGSVNAIYQKLIERLNWIENRHSTLEGDNIIKGKEAGIILTGHNWNVSTELEKQKQVFRFYGFEVPNELSIYWQWTSDATDESAEGYKREPIDFEMAYNKSEGINESFSEWIKNKKLL
jgi:multimeric flavodoxin WrbA